MSRRKKVIDWARVKAELIALKAEGYRVTGKIDHWKVRKPGIANLVYVWPTSQKMMVYDADRSHRYSDLLQELAPHFAPLVESKATKEWRDGLDKLLAEINQAYERQQ